MRVKEKKSKLCLPVTHGGLTKLNSTASGYSHESQQWYTKKERTHFTKTKQKYLSLAVPSCIFFSHSLSLSFHALYSDVWHVDRHICDSKTYYNGVTHTHLQLTRCGYFRPFVGYQTECRQNKINFIWRACVTLLVRWYTTLCGLGRHFPLIDDNASECIECVRSPRSDR